ncbi:hypothetical protein [Actinokineospora alba]|uniref:hypothetical protein n=1 Tax=Actinokineospora alba TaxID=504798 RepID=UPI001E37D05B|nr:hypothetical protein [Actinokineospora alba]
MAQGRGVRQPWLWPAVLVAVVLTATASLLARELYADDRNAPPPSAILPSAGALPPGEQPGHRDVRGTRDAIQHPMYETVRQLLQTYFDAINGKNYERWRTTVTADRIKNMPEETWRASYRSTQDGSIVVYRIETGPRGSARVMLTFISKQDVADAPLELPEPCIRWHVIFPLTVEADVWKLDAGPTGASPQHEKC